MLGDLQLRHSYTPARQQLRWSARQATPARHSLKRTQMRSAKPEANQQVNFPNSNGVRLAGVFTDAKSDEVVILCHGLASSKDGGPGPYPVLAKELARRGISSLRFDFTGNGDSGGAFSFTNYWGEVKDLRAAVEYVKKIGRKAHAIVGHSKGGGVVLLYAAQYDDVPYVVNIAGRFHMKAGLVERFGEATLAKVDKLGQVDMTFKSDKGKLIKFQLTKQDIKERTGLDMGEAAKAIKLSEVLTIHGSDDKTIPVADAHAFAQCIRQHQLHVIEGADHNFSTPVHADQLVRKVADYLASMM